MLKRSVAGSGSILYSLLVASIVSLTGIFPRVNPPSYPKAELATISLSPSKDNTLYEDAMGSVSNGAGESMFSGRTNTGGIRRALVAFDIAGNIPAGSSINSVSLTLHMSRTVALDETTSLRRLTANWGEGTSDAALMEGTGAPATTGDATWLHTFFNTVFWTNPGGDFAGTDSASVVVGAIGFYTWGSTPQMVADVQGWLDNPATNDGWIIIGNEAVVTTAKRFDTRENATPSNRPVLQIDYTPPAPPPFQILLPLVINSIPVP